MNKKELLSASSRWVEELDNPIQLCLYCFIVSVLNKYGIKETSKKGMLSALNNGLISESINSEYLNFIKECIDYVDTSEFKSKIPLIHEWDSQTLKEWCKSIISIYLYKNEKCKPDKTLINYITKLHNLNNYDNNVLSLVGFNLDLYENYKNSGSIKGYDKNIINYFIYNIYTYISNDDVLKYPPFVDKADALSLEVPYSTNLCYDLVFVDAPFYSKLSDVNEFSFINKALSIINKDGVVYSVLPDSCLNNLSYKEERRNLLPYIDTIIKLPYYCYKGLGIPLNLVILNKQNKEYIKLLDLTLNSAANNKNKELDICEEMEKAEKIYKKEIIENDKEKLSLTISSVKSNKQLSSFNYHVLEEYVECIKTGLRTSGKKIEDSLIDSYALVSMKDIDDLNNGLLHTEGFEYGDDCLNEAAKEGDILISCKSNVVKCCVVEKEIFQVDSKHYFMQKEIHLIPNDSLLLIRLKKDIANALDPYYLKAFLESELGNDLLKTYVMTGQLIISINKENLLKMPILYTSSEKQKEVADIVKNNIKENKENYINSVLIKSRYKFNLSKCWDEIKEENNK